MTTRARILSRAFGRIGVNDYQFDVTPDERADARVTLDAMMAEWLITGIDLGYTPSTDADNDADDMTTPTWADAAIWNNLAVRLAPDFGKAILTDVRRDAKRGYDLACAKTLKVPVERRPTQRIYGGADSFYRRRAY